MLERPEAGHSLLTRAEVADQFGVAPQTVTQWAKDGKLSPIRTLGGHRRYPSDQVLELIQESTNLAGQVTTARLAPAPPSVRMPPPVQR